MELNRKLITVILVVLIIVVPIVAFSWVTWGPSKLDSIDIESVSPDTKNADGVYIIATATGSGRDFSDAVDLLAYFENEQVYAGKAEFSEGYMAHKLAYTDFCVGNGEYQFRLLHEGLSSRYDFELSVVVEELGVVSSASYNYQADGAAVQPWETVYVYNVVFTTGWHYFTHTIEASKFRSYDLGTMFVGQSAPLKVQTGPEFGVTVEVWFTNQAGAQSKKYTYEVAAGDSLDQTLVVDQNGSYLYKYVNKYTTDITIQAYEDRAVDKIPLGGMLEIRQDLGDEFHTSTVSITEVDRVSGYFKHRFGPGEYDITISYPNPQVKPSDPLATVTYQETILLNDLPKANPRANPNRITTLQRTVTFDATDSFDDGPEADLWVYWSFGANAEGEIGHAEGPWEDYKTVTFQYPFGEDPNVVDGQPYLILKDAYGAESTEAKVNLQVG